ncbi:hypothetical protein ID867_06545 [Streptomyces parvulus]|nr:hypothetical protein [Streptomyces parvulus]
MDAESVYVLRRTVVLGDLSDCAVDGTYLGAGAAPTREDNVRALGELLQVISSKAGWDLPGLPEGMHLWQGDTWEQLRRLVMRCVDPEPSVRPAAAEVAEVLARYVARTRLQLGEAAAHGARGGRAARVPLAPPAADPRAPRPALRLPRFGAARREAQERLERLRAPLSHSRRLTLVGAYHYSGRATTTMLLGSVLAAVRGETGPGPRRLRVRRVPGRLPHRPQPGRRAGPGRPVVHTGYEEIRGPHHPAAVRPGGRRPPPRPLQPQPGPPAGVRARPRADRAVLPLRPHRLVPAAARPVGRRRPGPHRPADPVLRHRGLVPGRGRPHAHPRPGRRPEDLARRALVVATELDGPSGRSLPDTFARRCASSRAGGARALRRGPAVPRLGAARLRPATTQALLRLADLVTRED